MAEVVYLAKYSSKRNMLAIQEFTVECTSHSYVTCIMKYGKLSFKFEYGGALWSIMLIVIHPAL